MKWKWREILSFFLIGAVAWMIGRILSVARFIRRKREQRR